MSNGVNNSGPVDVRFDARRLGLLIEAFIGRIITRVIGTCTPARAASPVRHILIGRFDGIGDIVLTIPMLRALKTALPDAEITFVTRSAFLDLMATCPYIDHLVGADLSRTHFTGTQYLWRAFCQARNLKRDRHYDVAINPRVQANDPFTALMLCLSGAGRRIGFKEWTTSTIGHAGRFGLDNLLTDVVEPKSALHEVEQTFVLLRALGIQPSDLPVELWPDDTDKAYAEAFFQDHGISEDDLVIAIAPGCSDQRRIWPEDRFHDVCRELVGSRNARILVVGGPEDRPIAERLKASLNGSAAIPVGNASLRQTAALMGNCDLFIGNDSGPMHIGAAMGLPVVEISCHPQGGDPGHTNSPLRFGPWQVPQRILRPMPADASCNDYCSSQTAHCILGVKTSEVVSAALSLLPPPQKLKRHS